MDTLKWALLEANPWLWNLPVLAACTVYGRTEWWKWTRPRVSGVAP